MNAANKVSLLRGVIFLLGVLFESGMVPTGVDGLGPKIGEALKAFAITLAAGDFTSKAVKQATADVQEAQAEGRI